MFTFLHTQAWPRQLDYILITLLCSLPSSLKESLLPLLDEKESELAAELQDAFPDEILLSHATATWKAAALFKRERRES